MLPVRAAFFGSADLLGELQSWGNPWSMGQGYRLGMVPPAPDLPDELLW